MKYLFRNGETFHVIFASAMKRDYSVYPSMIGSESGLIYSYDNPQMISIFDDTHPLEVSASKCDDFSICLWYVSPVWAFHDPIRTKHALLGEFNKWTAVSRQRIVSITTNTEKTQTIIVAQGAPSEGLIRLVIYVGDVHIVNCPPAAASGQANFVITPAGVDCS